MHSEIRRVVELDFQKVDNFIIEQLYSEVSLVESIGHYIVDAGGKRMRPLLVLLAAHSCGIEGDKHISMAAVIEFIHTATLLHDDVVDMSTLRRGRPTVNAEWNNPSSVLVGDFIYSRAFQLLVKIDNMKIMEIIANTTNKIAEGEVLQLIEKNNPNTSEENYMRIIKNKTAILFQAATHCGAILANANSEMTRELRAFGMHLGVTFQLIDDALDYTGNSKDLGKNIGDDLAEGKSTLPLIYAMTNCSIAERNLILETLKSKEASQAALEGVLDIVIASGGIKYVEDLAESEAHAAMKCLNKLAASEYRHSLEKMVDFSINRRT